jgi:hypothetical protein
MPLENKLEANEGALYMIDKNGEMVEVAKLHNVSLILVNEISIQYKKYLKRIKNRNKLYNKLKKLGRNKNGIRY